MDYVSIIAAVSLAANAAFAWLWYRRKEIMAVVKKASAAYKDDGVSEDEFWDIMDELNKVLEKK